MLIRRWRPWLYVLDKVGRFIHATTSEGRWLAFGILPVLATATVVTQFWPIPHFWLIPAGFGLSLLVVWGLKARSTMVIEDFVDHTPSRSVAVGAAALLSIELESTTSFASSTSATRFQRLWEKGDRSKQQ